MPQKLQTNLIDYSNEIDDATIYTASPTAQERTDYRTALEALILGVVVEQVQIDETSVYTGSTTPPADQFAQKEIRWLVRYTDDVTSDRYRLYIPTADAAILNQPNSDFLNLTLEPVLSFVNEFESIARSENGNTVTVNSIELV
jgi:hypothetical protein